MISQAMAELEPLLPVKAACELVGQARSALYRQRNPRPQAERRPPRARQPGLCSPLPASDHARDEQAHPDAGPGRHCRGDPPATPRDHHRRPGPGPRHRRPRNPAPAGHACRRLSDRTRQAGGRGRALRGIEEPRLPRRSSWAAPPVASSTRSRAAGPSPITAMQGQTTDEAPGVLPDTNDLR